MEYRNCLNICSAEKKRAKSIIKQNIGLSVEESTIKELVKIAKSFDQKTIDNEVLKIKSVASDISVSNDDSFNRVARIYFALKKMKASKITLTHRTKDKAKKIKDLLVQ